MSLPVGKEEQGAWHGGLAGVVLADGGDGSAGVGLEGALVGARHLGVSRIWAGFF